MKPILLIFLAAAFTLKANNALTTLEISSDTTLCSNLIIDKNTVCILKPGITVRFDGYWGIQVRGKLIALGTADKPIVIKAIDWNRGSEKANWRGIEIAGEKVEASLKFCRVEGAYRNLLQVSDVKIDSCGFSGNHYALYCEKKAQPQIRNTLFSNNNAAVTVHDAHPVLHSVTIRGNKIGLHCISDCAEISGKTIIKGNGTDRLADSFDDPNASSPSRIWDLLLQLF